LLNLNGLSSSKETILRITAVPVQSLPDNVLYFLLPSRYCQSDLLGKLTREIIAGMDSGYDQVEAIRSWIHNHIDYQYDTSDASTSAN
jgi:transglutaminase-like putative cysteine protease